MDTVYIQKYVAISLPYVKFLSKKKLERELRPLSRRFKSNRACFQEGVSGANIGRMKEVRITSSTIGLQYFRTFASVDEFCVISPVASGLVSP